MKNLVTRLELELHELKASDKDNPNVFSAVTKTLARKVGSLANPALALSPLTPTQIPVSSSQPPDATGDDYMEQSMKRAQEDVEVLRSLVLPLEEEIKALKDKLRTADDQLRTYEANQVESYMRKWFLFYKNIFIEGCASQRNSNIVKTM